MALESATYINGLNASNPVGATDPKSQGDDHIRLLKSTLLATFPNINAAVTATPANLNGVTNATNLTSGTLPDARLSANVPLLNANNTFSGDFQVSSVAPEFRLTETDQGADAKTWDFHVSGSALIGRAVNDALTLANNWVTVARSGYTISSIAFAATAITFNGVNVTDYARLSQSNTFTGATQTITVVSANARLRAQRTGTGAADGQFGTVTGAVVVTADGTTPLQFLQGSTVMLEIGATGNFDFKAGQVTTTNTTANEVGYKGAPQNTQTAVYTLALTDAGKTVKATSSATTITVPDDAAVNFPAGTIVRIHNRTGSAITVTKTTAAGLLLNGSPGTTGARTLPNNSVCEVYKSQSDEWIISGPVT